MSTDHPEAPRPLPDRPNLRHLKDQAKDLLKTGAAAIDHRCAVQDRASLRVCELAEAQGSRRLPGGDRATQAGDRHQRHRSRQDPDDAQPGAAQRSTWLRQRWAAHVGGRMPRPMGITESGETGHGGVDARTRVGRAPGGRRTADASRAQWISHPDDGAARVPRCGCERPVARTFPHHLCPLRVTGSGRSQMASRSRRKSELSRPTAELQPAIPIQARLSTTSLRRLRAFCRTTERLHRHPSRGRWRDQVRRAGCVASCCAAGSTVWPGRSTLIPHSSPGVSLNSIAA